MKYNIFDVIELYNNDKGIIVDIVNRNYTVKTITENIGEKTIEITEDDIKSVLFKKKR